MTKPRKAVELNFEDLAGPGVAAGGAEVETPGGPPEVETGGDMVSQVQGLMDQVNTVITNAKELVAMFRGISQNSGPGAGIGKGPAQPYAPQPTLMQQLHRLVNIAYSAYGDITVAQLLEALMTHYGGTKLSAVLKALEKVQ